MTFWLVNSGTTEDPLRPEPGQVRRAFDRWHDREGPYHGVDRAYGMRPGDVLIYRSVGTNVSRLVAHGVVLAAPERHDFARWHYRVKREIHAVVPTLRDAPPFDQLAETPVRMTKRLNDATGRKAVELIEAAATNPRSGRR